MTINLKIYILDYLPISEKQEAFSNIDMLINLQVQYILKWTDSWTQITHREQFLVQIKKKIPSLFKIHNRVLQSKHADTHDLPITICFMDVMWQNTFFNVFITPRKITISFAMFVCLQTTQLSLDWFSQNLILDECLNICQDSSSLNKIWPGDQELYTKTNVCLWHLSEFFSEWEMF